MDLEVYQDLGVDQEPADAAFATIGQVYGDGVSLIFDGQTAATQKHYKCNRFGKFSAGDRVKIIRDSNTYVVEYPVGVPITSLSADYANSAGSATSAGTATRAAHAMRLADNGSTTAYILVAYSNGGYYIKASSASSWKRIDNV